MMLINDLKKFIVTKYFLIPLILISAISIFLCFIPLFNILGYEFSLELSLPVSITSAFVVLSFNLKIKDKIQNLSFYIPFAANCLILIVSLIIILTNAFFVKNCNFTFGFKSFILMPFFSCLVSSAIAFFILIFKCRFIFSFMIFILIFILNIAFSIAYAIYNPQIFCYNIFFGYFQGPIYDEVIDLSTLSLYRFFSLALSTSLIFSATLIFNRRINLKILFLIIISFVVFSVGIFFRNEFGFVSDRRYIQDYLGGKAESEHFIIFYEKGAISSDKIKDIIYDHEFNYFKLTEILKINPTKKITSYIYKTEDQKKRLMGGRDVLFGDFYDYEMHMNYETPPIPYLRHEMAHVLSSYFGHPIFKGSYYLGLIEGLATALDFFDENITLHEKTKAMFDLKKAPSIENTMTPLGFWTKQSTRAYILCGSFVRFLIDQYGIENFRKIYVNGNFEAIYNKDLKKLILEWKDFLFKIELTKEAISREKEFFLKESIFEKVCAHEVARLLSIGWQNYLNGNYKSANYFFYKANVFDKNNISSYKGITLSLLKLNENELSIMAIDHLLNLKILSPKDLVFAYNLYGENFMRLQNFDKANKYFLKIQENNLFENYLDEAFIKSSAIDCNCLTEYLSKNDFLSIDSKIDLLKLFDDKKIKIKNKNYLFGKLFFIKENYDKSSFYLSNALLSEDLSQNDRDKALYYLGYSLLNLKKYESALLKFEEIIKHSNTPAMREMAIDWIERCKFYVHY